MEPARTWFHRNIGHWYILKVSPEEAEKCDQTIHYCCFTNRIAGGDIIFATIYKYLFRLIGIQYLEPVLNEIWQ